MRLCRYEMNGEPALGFYFDDRVLPLHEACAACGADDGRLPAVRCVLELLPGGGLHDEAAKLWAWVGGHETECSGRMINAASVRLQAPVPNPGKILLLAGNYADHIKEEGKIALERAETFPYLFMKPRTCVNDPGAPVLIPKVNPDFMDYEAELGVIIGKRGKHLAEREAMDYVAGYTVINDFSDRRYKPNPQRKERERDAFFDWQHGKWHDGLCPMGPCAISSAHFDGAAGHPIALRVNGEERQNASTGQMIYPVAAIIEFITRSMTLEPGDIIATGTPSGVGMASGRFLKPGDEVEAVVDGIGILRNTLALEK